MLKYKIDFTKTFTKQFKLLRYNQKQRFYERLQLFKMNPNNPVLRDHALKGKQRSLRSIDITGDLRALYYVEGDTVIIFAFIGTHSQLY
jgi:addiction module RelE/StbE family toxin